MILHRHFILHKPYGTISQFVNPHKRKKGLLGDLYDFPEGTMAIGRLDVNSEGLLLLTTDGKMSEHIRSKKDFQNIFTYFSKYPNPDRYKEQTYKEQYNELFRRRFPGIVIKELLIKRLKAERFSPEEFVEILNEDRSFHLEVFDALLEFNGAMAMKYYDSKENSIGIKEQYISLFDSIIGKQMRKIYCSGRSH